MADSSLIREFLVGLGFKIDVDSEKKFRDGVEGATKKTEELDKAQVKAGKSAVKMAASIVGVGAWLAERSTNFAAKLEDLHFAAKRTGAAASSLKAVANAAQDVGASAEEAQGSIENVARFMRNNPAGESYIASLGVQTRDANGHLRDTVAIVNDIGRALSKKDVWLANQYAQQLGISENFMLGMRDPTYFTSYDRAKQDYDKSGVDSSNNTAHNLMTDLRHFQSGLEGKLGTVGAWGVETGAVLGGGVMSYFGAKQVVQEAIGKALGAGGKAATGAGEAAAGAAGAAAEGAGAGEVAAGAGEAAAAAGGGEAAGAAGEAAAAAAGAATEGVAGRLVGLLGPLGVAAELMTHSEGLNKGEQETLDQYRPKEGQQWSPDMAKPGASNPPDSTPGPTASPPVAAGQPDAAGAPPVSWAQQFADSPIGRLIAKLESGSAGYSAINVPTLNSKGKTVYKASTADLAGMTVDEILAAQKDRKMFAVGRYQIVRNTLLDAMKSMGLTGDEKFDKELQDRIFGEYLIGKRRPKLAAVLAGKSGDMRAGELDGAREWASLPNPDTGRSYYDGVGGNHALTSVREYENAIRNSMLLYQLSPEMIAASQRGHANHIEVHNDVKIQVTGAGDPDATAKSVAREQQTVASNTIRDFQGALE